MYDDLEGMLEEIENHIANYDENISKTELAIENAASDRVTAEMVSAVMAAIIEKMDTLSDEDKRLMMHYLLDSVQLHEKRQDDGWWVKSLRFKVAINIDGQVFDVAEVVNTNSLPNENHDETVVSLGRKNPEDVEYAYLDYEPSESIPIKGGATYSEIKDWILEQYGLKVSSLYVAQI